MPKDKYGNQLTWKEFFTRWKQGIDKVTELQKVGTQIFSTWIVVIGLLCGIVVGIWKIRTYWWLLIIFTGALINTSVGLLGLYQRRKMLKIYETPQFEETNEMEVLNNESESTI